MFRRLAFQGSLHGQRLPLSSGIAVPNCGGLVVVDCIPDLSGYQSADVIRL